MVTLSQINLINPIKPSYYNLERTDGFIDLLPNKKQDHKGFYASTEQKLHVDGTLYNFNEIKTSVLYCVEPAKEGGESLLFDGIKWFLSASKRHQRALLDRRALTRASVSLETYEEKTDSVFKIENGVIYSRFSIDNTSIWNFDIVPNLKDAYEFLIQQEVLEIKLQKNNLLIMDNTRLSHGRNAFRGFRHLIRGLYYNHPF